MAGCPDQELILGGLVDCELDAANTARAEAHVARCDRCGEELERLHAIKNLLRIDGVRDRAPAKLRQHILTLQDLSRHIETRRDRLFAWFAPVMAGALAASLAFVTFGDVTRQAADFDAQIVSGHVRSLQPGHLIDIATSNKHVVKPWFNGRIDFAPPVPDLAAQGFPLAGGRLDSIEGKTIAAIVYKRRLHAVNVFVWRGSGGPRTFQQDGYAVVEWSEGRLRFAAISDISVAELEQFEKLYRQST